MYVVYVLNSKKSNKYYIGYTENISQRLLKHNSGGNRSTKYGRPWDLVYSEEYQTRSEAYKREKQIKKMKGGVQFKALLTNGDVG